MKRTLVGLGLASVMMLALAACGTTNKEGAASSPSAAPVSSAAVSSSPSASPAAKANEPRKITYLGKEYMVPAKADKIVITGAMEAMEDALVLGVKPVGAISVGGKFPAMFAKITDSAESIGEKTQPNVETILKLKPDVILGTSKFPAETVEKLNKVATTLPVSHISTDWESNLNLLAELTGKQEQAKQVLQKYKDDLKAVKDKISAPLKDKKVMAIRIRAGSINIYPADVFFNPSLYAELGLTPPEELKQAKAQQVLSIEKFSEINPDYIFVQFSEDENKDQPKSLEDLQKNPIWQSINAVKNGKVFVNVVDPLAQGGTAYSKIAFLEAASKSLTN
jgi:iron complex transport system substrate-binding protein